MNQDQYNYETDWIAKISERNLEYAKNAYEKQQAGDTKQAEAYMCYLIGSLESLKDMYPVLSTDTGAGTQPQAKRKTFDIKRVLLGP